MHEKEFGVVLRRFTNNVCKFSVITRTLGKISLVVIDTRTAQQIQPGSILEFDHLDHQDSIHLSTNLRVHLIILPQQSADLIWIHHALEICYYFSPQHEPSFELFTIIKNYLILIASNDFSLLDERTKKLFIGAMLFLLGFFPPSALEKPIVVIKNSLLLFVDFDKKTKVQFLKKQIEMCSISIGIVDDWLLSCLETHPRVQMFKTMQFIYNKSSTQFI